MRIGEIEFEFSTVIVLTLIVFFTMGAGGFVEQLQDILNRGYANLDNIRIDNSVESLHGEPSARVRLELRNDYNFSLAGDGIRMDADFMNQQQGMSIRFVPWFNPRFQPGVSGEIRTDEICLIKQGFSVTVAGPGNCQPTPCGPDSEYGVCSTFKPAVQSQQARCSGGNCQPVGGEWYAFPEGVPADGYVCENGSYTDEGFFVEYRNNTAPTCNATQGDFIDINRVTCPNQAILDEKFGCVVRTTLRCPAGDKINVEVDHDGITEDPDDLIVTQQERDDAIAAGEEPPEEDYLLADTTSVIRRCSGDVQHERVPFTLTANDTTRRYELDFTVSTPSGQESRTDGSMRVLP